MSHQRRCDVIQLGSHVCFVSLEAMAFLPSSGKSFILGRVDEAVSNELGLGELAGLTVANEADNLAYDVSDSKVPENTERHSVVKTCLIWGLVKLLKRSRVNVSPPRGRECKRESSLLPFPFSLPPSSDHQ